MNARYQKSENLLKKSLQVIPLGSQTFSKSYLQFPFGVSPYFLERGKGAYVWDIDGNCYLDAVNALMAVSIGYCDKDIDSAVLAQMQKGVTFSLATELEEKLARKMVAHIPSAEMVRFFKNGTDATSGAIRIARAVTGKDHVLVCGYHGWQDWYIGSTSRDLGVPKAVKALTHHFQYNNIESLADALDQYKNQVAAVIMEPMNIEYPKDNFLENCKKLAHQHNALFIFDETITGFRFALGGAQQYFNVTPDLSTFGKGMANGYPISAIVGKKEYMDLMTDVFLSSTFGGETLSLAASLAVMEKLEKNAGVEHMHSIGKKIINNTQIVINENNLQDVFSLSGHPSWSFLVIKDTEQYSLWEIKTLWMQECLQRGFLSFGTHNVSYAYQEKEIKFIQKIYQEVLEIIAQAIKTSTLKQKLICKPLKPLFKVR